MALLTPDRPRAPKDSTPLPRLTVHGRHWQLPAPPGPDEAYPLSELRAIMREGVLPYLQRMTRTHGNLVRVRFGPAWMYIVNEPELIRNILQRDHRVFVKGWIAEQLREAGGWGIFFSEGAMHRRQRKLMQPAFHRGCLARYAGEMTDCLHQLEADWEDGARLDIAAAMNRLTMNVVARSLFSSVLEEEMDTIAEAMEALMASFIDRIFSPTAPLQRYLPPQVSSRRYHRAVRTLNEVAYRLIDSHPREASVMQDVMGILMMAQDEEGGEMSRQQLRDEAMTLFIAGHETTAIALSWAWYEISRNPVIQAKLHAEVDHVLGGRTPGFEDVPRLRYCRNVFQEALRHYPPVYLFMRQALEDYPLGDYTLPEGAHVALSPYLTQHDPRFYPHPELFDPDRWTDAFQAALPKFAFFPFSGGPRICLGEHFAWTEGVLTLAHLAQHWRVALTPHQQIGYGRSASLRPANGIEVALERRQPIRV